MAHRLSDEERQRILLTCNEPEFAALAPGQVVSVWPTAGCLSFRKAALTGCCTLTDRCTVAVEHGHHRNQERCRGSGRRSEPTLELGHHLSAHHRVRGILFYLHLVIDVWSRKAVVYGGKSHTLMPLW